jgi:methionyl-tRNA synthetase
VQADALARHYRQANYDVFFCSGTDENALKNVQTAEKEGVTTQEIVDKYSKPFAEFKDLLNISYDRFVRTSQEFHFKGCQAFWKRCEKDIYKKKYKGLYCVGCEEFKTEKDLNENGLCPEHKVKPELVEEENYFFKLSNYQDYLKDLIVSDTLKIYPLERKNEILSFIEQGLQDFSISRSKERAKGWGIPVPGDESQYMYVWFDALINYITGLDFPDETGNFEKFWSNNPNRFHVIGKGIIRFHAIYWPAMLKSADLPVPTKEFVHGYITTEGEKISKSLGNVISPEDAAQKYGQDPFRYYLLKEVNPFIDGDFSWSRFEEIYNAGLANGLGNLVQRVATLCEKNEISYKNDGTEKQFDEEVAAFIENFEFHLGLTKIWKKIQKADQYVNQKQPWKLSGEEVQKVLYELVEMITTIATDLYPFLPDTSEKILAIFDGKISAPEKPLFPRA